MKELCFKDPTTTFGVPFLLKVKQGEKYSQVKSRVQKMLELSDKDFEKVKSALRSD